MKVPSFSLSLSFRYMDDAQRGIRHIVTAPGPPLIRPSSSPSKNADDGTYFHFKLHFGNAADLKGPWNRAANVLLGSTMALLVGGWVMKSSWPRVAHYSGFTALAAAIASVGCVVMRDRALSRKE